MQLWTRLTPGRQDPRFLTAIRGEDCASQKCENGQQGKFGRRILRRTTAVSVASATTEQDRSFAESPPQRSTALVAQEQPQSNDRRRAPSVSRVREAISGCRIKVACLASRS